MGHVKNKLSQRAGDTLIETIAAILIVALSAVLLLSAAAVSVNANRKTIAADEKFAAEIQAAEAMTETSSSGSINITAQGFSKSVAVTYFGKEGELISYKVKPSEEGGG